ncbi:hypothetical protein V6N13_138440 [Hibiscus sabdariffa]
MGSSKEQRNNNGVSGKSPQDDVLEEWTGKKLVVVEIGSSSILRVNGHVEEESLWKLQKCLIGVTASKSDLNRILDRLCSWGISVQNLSGDCFLLSFKKLELYKFLKDLNSSYLKEVFIEVYPWRESFRIPKRFIWLEVAGLPIHCWNQIMFNRIVTIWGRLEALGENANLAPCLDRVTLLISMARMENIE